MPWDGLDRRADGRPPEGSPVAALRVEIRLLNDSVQRLAGSVEKILVQLAKVDVLESKHEHQGQAISRAFASIERIEEDMRSHIAAANQKHAAYDKYIWMAIGFCAAMSLLWTVVGYRINGLIDDNVKAVAEMRAHIAADKIINADDVKGVIK